MTKAKRMFPVPLMIAAVWILANPNLSIIDLLPDVIAYALILFSLRHLATFAPYMGDAADHFRKLFYISLAKIPALFIMIFLAAQRVTITVFSLSFAILELVFLIPAIHNLFEGFFYLGSRFGCRAAIAETPRKPDTVRAMTYIFIGIKMALSTLPDFLFLFEYDPLSGDGFSVTTTQYLFVLLIAFLIALVVGIIWLSYILPYLREIAKEQAVSPIHTPEGERLSARESRRLRISLPYFLFAMGLCLSIDFVIDYKNALPDYLAALSFLAVSLILLIGKVRFSRICLIFSAIYTASAFIFSYFRNRFYNAYSESDLTRIPAADNAYLPVMITSAIAEILFIVTVFILVRVLIEFRKSTMPECAVLTEIDRRFLLEEKKEERKQAIILLAAVTFSAICSFLNVLLLRINSPVAMQPGYGGGALYLPKAGAFWVLAFFLSLAAAGYGSYLASARVERIRNAIEEG